MTDGAQPSPPEPGDRTGDVRGDATSSWRRPVARQTSAPAVAATVALVMFSVFIGLYGPRLGNRQQLPGGTTLVELAHAIEPRHAQRVIEAAQQGTEGLLRLRRARGTDSLGVEAREELEKSRLAAEAEVARQCGLPIVLPQPADHRVLWGEPERVRVPGAGGVLAFCTLVSEGRGASNASNASYASYATILFLEDEDRFTIFDAHGRPRPMPEGEVFSVAGRMPSQGADGWSSEASGADAIRFFRTGTLIVAVQASNPEVADEFVRLLESMAARLGAGGLVQPGPALGGSH